MKIDKKQSVKNKVGVVLASLALSSTLMTPTALAASSSYSNDQVRIDFVYEDDMEPFVKITDLEDDGYASMMLEEFEQLLEEQGEDPLIIGNTEFSRADVLPIMEERQNDIENISRGLRMIELILYGTCLLGIGIACLNVALLVRHVLRKKRAAYSHNQVRIDFIYEYMTEPHTKSLVKITNLANYDLHFIEEYDFVFVEQEELEKLLNEQSGDTLAIGGVEFPKDDVLAIMAEHQKVVGEKQHSSRKTGGKSLIRKKTSSVGK